MRYRRWRHFRRRRADQGYLFSHQVGKAYQIVRDWFLSQTSEQLRGVFDDYERQHGRGAASYARRSFQLWRSGSVRISGLIADRLFKLLPAHMPAELKVQMVQLFWEMDPPQSNTTMRVGPGVDADLVWMAFMHHTRSFRVAQSVPRRLTQQFDWLCSNDVLMQQRLLNQLQKKDAQVALEGLKDCVQLFCKELARTDHATKNIQHTTKIGGHSFSITFNDSEYGISIDGKRVWPAPGCRLDGSPNWLRRLRLWLGRLRPSPAKLA